MNLTKKLKEKILNALTEETYLPLLKEQEEKIGKAFTSSPGYIEARRVAEVSDGLIRRYCQLALARKKCSFVAMQYQNSARDTSIYLYDHRNSCYVYSHISVKLEPICVPKEFSYEIPLDDKAKRIFDQATMDAIGDAVRVMQDAIAFAKNLRMILDSSSTVKKFLEKVPDASDTVEKIIKSPATADPKGRIEEKEKIFLEEIFGRLEKNEA